MGPYQSHLNHGDSLPRRVSSTKGSKMQHGDEHKAGKQSTPLPQGRNRQEPHIPIHATRQVCLGEMSTFDVIGTGMGFDAFQIRHHDILTLA